jgi:hypothetical protein
MPLKTALSVLAVAALCALAALVGFVRDFSGDFHWHVVLGQQILDERAIVSFDTFSHTFRGQPLLVTSWLGDVMLAWAFGVGEYAACYALRAACLVAVFALLCRDMVARGVRPSTAAALLGVVLSYATFLFYLKPEMFAHVSFVAVLCALGAHERTDRRRFLVAVLIAIAFWANTHGSVSLGLVAIGCYASWRAVRAPRAWKRLLSWATLPAAAIIVSFANPEGPALVFSFSTITPAFAARTHEWLPLAKGGLPPALIIAALVAGTTTLLAARRTSPWLLALVVVLAVLGWQYRRIATFALFAAAPLVAANLSAIRQRLMDLGRWPRWRALASVLAVATAVGACAQLFGVHGLHREVGLGIDRRAYPESACAFAKRARFEGRMLNSYDLGSFLMHCLPEHAVFIDQRAMSLYSERFYLRYIAAGEEPGVLESLVREHDIAWAFVKYDPLGARMAADPRRWRLVWFDDATLLYVRIDPPRNDHVVGFRALDPSRLGALSGAHGAALEEARHELERQRRRCADCMRTRLAEAAIAVASRDDAAFARARTAALAFGDRPEIAMLSGRHASSRGRHALAALHFARVRALGGDPVLSLVSEARAWAAAGDRRKAQERLTEASRYPGAAAAVARVTVEILGPENAAPSR